MKMLIG